MVNERKIAELEKRVAYLKDQVALAAATCDNSSVVSKLFAILETVEKYVRELTNSVTEQDISDAEMIESFIETVEKISNEN
ncbi:MAG TPA: hypothetical protein GX497_12820 [Bacillus bacterium]|nr:hypothetical protein [Bacillus sp. (in: firmicutes)]